VPTVKVAEDRGLEARRGYGQSRRHELQDPSHARGGARGYENYAARGAGAYTIFSNQGEYVKPSFLSLVRDQSGKAEYKNKIERRRAIDPAWRT